MYPKISIVTTCHNRREYIRETMESVLSQGYPNLEYIVIDDGSTDGSWEVINEYRSRLAYCERLEGERDTHILAINHGLSKVTGDVMGWLNDKNILMPKSLFTIAAIFTQLPDVEWVTGIGLLIDGNGLITSVIPVRKDKYDYLTSSTRANIQQESTYWRRTLWEKAGGKLEEKVASDADLWCKFFRYADLYHVNTLIGAYRKHSTSWSLRRRDIFYDQIKEAGKELYKSLPFKKRLYAILYSYIRYAKPLLRNIPDRVYIRIPILKEYSHNAIRFNGVQDNQGVLEIYKRNPFRTIFPW